MPELNPTLAFVNLKVATSKWADSTEFKALHDSGCAATTMSTKAFMKLTDSDKTIISQPKKTIMVQSCTGELTPTRGLAELCLQFNGANGQSLLIRHNVIICDQIDFDFILGRDITGSSLKIAETNDYLYLSELTERIYNLSTYLLTHKQQICDVPISNRSLNSFDVYTSQDIELPPFTMCNISCHISKEDKPFPQKIGDGAVLFEIVSVNVSDLCHLRNTVLAYTDPSAVSIPLFNDTNDYYFIEANTQIVQIEHFDSNQPMYEMQMKSLDGDIFKLNNIQPSFISNDEFMSEEEKEAAFIEFAEKGFFQPSMSHLIEEAPTITELELKNVEPYPEQRFEDLFKLDHLPSHQKKIAKKVIKKHKLAFSKHDQDIGKVNCIEMDIQIDETKPRIQKYIPVPHAARPQLRQILDQMEEYNIIRECNEPSLFCSNLLVVPKKDKKLIRIILDGRLLNNATIRQPTNLVNSAEIKLFLTNKDWITTIDVSHAFYQIPLSEKSQPLTAFYSEAHGKRYCFMRAPQGLKNSPLHLKLLMDKLFGHMCDVVIHYVDDIMIATKGTFEEHMKAVGEVFAQMEKSNLLINPKKVFLAQESIEFLGIVWKKGSLHIPEAKLSAFKTFPMPNTPKRTKSFVCAMSYYRQFIPRFAEMSKPLMDLAQLHPKQFKWEEVHTKNFKRMIQAIIDNCSLILPQPNEPFFVQTDASDVCGAGRVFQKNKEGEEQLLACISRTFTRAERKYGAFKKEVLALLYTLRSMDYFLRHACHITILVDAKAIIFLRLCKDSSGILLRFSLEISRYDAEIHHVSGENNFISDILSRHNTGIDEIIQEKKTIKYLSEQQAEDILMRLTIPHLRKFSKEEVAYLLEAESLIDPIPKKPKRSTAKAGKRVFPNMPETLHERKIKMPKESLRRPGVLLPTCSCSPLQIEECNHPTMNYDELKHIAHVLIGGKINTKTFIQMQKADENIQRIEKIVPRSNLFFHIDKVLYFGKKKPKPVLPDALLDLLIQSKHFTVFGLHNSATRMKRDILSQYHVTRKILGDKLKMLKTNCLVCQFNKSNSASHELKVSDFRRSPQSCWAVDIIPNMPLTKNGNKAIFLAIDMFTGFVSLSPLKSRKAEDLIQAFTSAILNPFKIPQVVRCDNETGMANSTDFTKFFEKLGTRFEPTSTASPWSNGAAERAVQTIKNSLRKFTMQEHIEEEWDSQLHYFNGAHNASTSVYGFSPNELHFGYNLPKQTDLLQFWPKAKTQEEYMELIVPLANEARTNANNKALRENERVLTYRNKNRSTKTFQIGEVVLHKQLQVATGTNMGMKPKFTGPYVITGLDKHDSSATIENLSNGRTMKAHFTNLQLFSYHPNFSKLPHNFDEQIFKHMPYKASKHKYFPETSENSQENPEDEEHEEEEINQQFEAQTKSNNQLTNDDIDQASDDLNSQQQDLIDHLNSEKSQGPAKVQQSQHPPSNDLNIGTCDTCQFHYTKCTCVPATQINPTNDDDTIQKDKKNRNINFGENIENILTTECIEHPDPCYCTFNDSSEYGYRSEYDFDPKQLPTKSCLTKSVKYGVFHPPIFRPHKICPDTGYVTNDYDAQPASHFQTANQGIVTLDIDPTKHNINIIQRDDLPLGIIDDNIPPDVYHHTLNPNPSTDNQSRTEEGPDQDSGIAMDIDSEDTEPEASTSRYQLRKRKFTNYKEAQDYKPRSNSRTDKTTTKDDSAKKFRTEDNSTNKINSIRLSTNLSYPEKRLYEHLICKIDLGYEMTTEETNDIQALQMKHMNNPSTPTRSRTEETHINRITSLRRSETLSTPEKRRLEHLLCKIQIGYEMTNDENEEIHLLQKKQTEKYLSSANNRRLSYYSVNY